MDLRLIENTALSLIKEYIHSHSGFVFEVASDYSMSPFLKKGDKIVIDKAVLKNLSLGDIVVFNLKDNFCVHRFLYKYKLKNKKRAVFYDSYLLITKGDNSINPDNPLTEDQLLGKAVMIQRGKKEIYLENILWKIINRILGVISLYQVCILKPYRFIRNFFGKDKKIPFIILIKRALSFILLLPSKSIVFILNLLSPFCSIMVRETMELKDPNLPSEDRFILLCSRTQMDEDQIQLAQKIAQDKLDWDYIFQKAQENGVAPLIYQNLRKINDLIPSEIIENFKMAYIISCFENERLYEDLREILKTFNNEKIPVFVYKGAVLGEIVYRDIAFRSMFDIDLLVRIEDWLRIKDILSRLNFIPLPFPEYFVPDKEVSSATPIDYHIPYGNKKNTRLEFKFHLFWLDFPKFETKRIWENAKIAKIAEADVYIPPPEDQILLHCISLLRHNYRGLIWFCDISELIRHYEEEINWKKLIKKSQRKSVSLCLYYGLLFTTKLLNTKIPQNILNELRPNYFRCKLFESFYDIANIFKLKKDTQKFRFTRELELLLLDKVRFSPKVIQEIISYFLKLIFPPVKFMTYRYSIPQNFPKIYLYYFKRLNKFFYLGLNRIFRY